MNDLLSSLRPECAQVAYLQHPLGRTLQRGAMNANATCSNNSTARTIKPINRQGVVDSQAGEVN
jgi:hypothetical protein